jgi:hypothetical protein
MAGELGLGTAGRVDSGDDFEQEFLSALSRHEEHTTVDALCSALCIFAARYRASSTAKPLTKCDLGVGDLAEAATAGDYETALRSFVATLRHAQRTPRYEGGAAAAVGV